MAQASRTNAATVSGQVLQMAAPNSQVQPRSVRFVSSGQLVLETQADEQGTWHAQIAPGTYDVIFGGPLFGERVDGVELHAGVQEFSPITPRFAYGHLGLNRDEETTVTVGAMEGTTVGMSLRYAVRHPVTYLAMMRRRLPAAL